MRRIGSLGYAGGFVVVSLCYMVLRSLLQLTLLRARLAERHIELELSDAAKEHIAREGYDPVYGARPLKRFLQRHLETPLSRRILAGDVRDHSRVTVDFKKGELLFESTPLKKEKES